MYVFFHSAVTTRYNQRYLSWRHHLTSTLLPTMTSSTQFRDLFAASGLLVDGTGNECSYPDLPPDGVLGLYFTAQCFGHEFTPTLVTFYRQTSTSRKLAMISVSLDDDQSAFDELRTTMPWPALKTYDEQGTVCSEIRSKYWCLSLYISYEIVRIHRKTEQIGQAATHPGYTYHIAIQTVLVFCFWINRTIGMLRINIYIYIYIHFDYQQSAFIHFSRARVQ